MKLSPERVKINNKTNASHKAQKNKQVRNQMWAKEKRKTKAIVPSKLYCI